MRPRHIDSFFICSTGTPDSDSLFVSEFGQPEFRTPIERLDARDRTRGLARCPEGIARQNPTLQHISHHFVVYRSGVVCTGRHGYERGGVSLSGAIEIALIGSRQFTEAQFAALYWLLAGLQERYPKAKTLTCRREETRQIGLDFDVASLLADAALRAAYTYQGDA